MNKKETNDIVIQWDLPPLINCLTKFYVLALSKFMILVIAAKHGDPFTRA